MQARNRVFLILGILLLISLVWYLATTRRSGDLQLIGTVDANEVIVSSRITGRIQTLNVDEGQTVKAGELLATIESQDLSAAEMAAAAAAQSEKYKQLQTRDTVRQTAGSTTSQVANAEAMLRNAQASLLQAKAQEEHQELETRRTTALAESGVLSAQARDDARTALDAAKAAVDAAKEQVSAAEASLKLAQANTIQAEAAEQTERAAGQDVANARAMLKQAQVQTGYASVVAPISGMVDVRAARQGEVVTPGAPIVTIVDLTQTWIYAPLPETQADAVRIGDSLRVVMPSGAALDGKVIAKAAEGDFATQRDVSRRKRDIKTVRLKLLIPNDGMKYVPGMTAEVYIPKAKLVAR